MERPDVAADEPRDDVIVGEQGDYVGGLGLVDVAAQGADQWLERPFTP